MIVDPQIEYFFDTNVLVYAYDRSAGTKHAVAAQLVQDCWENENGCLSIQVLQEFFVTATQKIPVPLDHATARQIVADLTEWRLHTPEASDLLQAIDFHALYQLQFWDGMILQSAARLGCKQLLSEDLSSGQIFGELQVVNPFLV